MAIPAQKHKLRRTMEEDIFTGYYPSELWENDPETKERFVPSEEVGEPGIMQKINRAELALDW